MHWRHTARRASSGILVGPIGLPAWAPPTSNDPWRDCCGCRAAMHARYKVVHSAKRLRRIAIHRDPRDEYELLLLRCSASRFGGCFSHGQSKRLYGVHEHVRPRSLTFFVCRHLHFKSTHRRSTRPTAISPRLLVLSATRTCAYISGSEPPSGFGSSGRFYRV